MSNSMNRGTAVVGMVLTFVAGAGFMYAYERGQTKPEIGADSSGSSGSRTGGGPAWKQGGNVPVSSEDPQLGPKNALVTLVVFSDYECPFCSRVEPTLKQLREQYGDRIRIVWKDLPLGFHKTALPAASAAQAVFLAKGNEAFWKFHDKLFSNQKALTEENFVQWAAEVGVSKSELEKYRSEGERKAKANAEEAGTLGVRGTPNTLIDGESVSGAQPIDQFKKVIEAHMKQAEQLKSKGISELELYPAMVAQYYKKAAAADEGKDVPDDHSVWKVPVGNSPVKGKPDALVTIVTFSEFQCPFCKRVEPSLEKVQAEYKDKVRFVFKHYPLPFHSRAIPASNFAIEAMKQKGHEGFWAAHKKLFDIQPKLEDADLEQAAKDLGLDIAKVMNAVKNNVHKDVLAQDQEIAEKVTVQGTPHSFVNGRVVNGAQPYEAFKKIVDEELAKAEALVKSGVPAIRVYDELTKAGKGGSASSTPLAIPAYAPTKGPKDAKVVIHVFSDFECPYCKTVEISEEPKADPSNTAAPPMPARKAVMKMIEEKYGNEVRIVWRNYPLPFHSHAKPAAIFATFAKKTKGDDVFWKVHDELFASQTKLENATFEAIAQKYGIDWAKAKDAIDKNMYSDEIDQDMKDAQSAGISGTPSFVINGEKLVGAQPFEKFQQVIDKMKSKPAQ